MNIKSSTTKIATRFFTLTAIIVSSLIALESHAQVFSAPTTQLGKQSSASSEPSAEVKNAVFGTLRQTTNRIYFERNEGQFHNPEVMYGFHTHFGSMGVYHNKLRIVSTQKEKEEEKPGEVDAEEPAQIQIVDITFPGSKNNWTVETGTKSTVVGSYYDKDGKGVTPALYNEITLKNVYPGVDLRLYSGKMGSLEFDWLVTKASDYEKIRMNFNGQDSLNIEKDGNLLIKLHDNDMKMVIPETYQMIDGNKNVLQTRMAKIGDENTLCYKVSGNIDPKLPMVIDPVMIWSTFMNNASNTFDEYLYAVTSTSAGNVYCAGVCDEQLTTAYMSGVAAGYSGNYIGTANGHDTNSGATSECIVYEFNATGTAILAWSFTGITVIVNNGQTNPLPLVPTDVAVFPNGRVIVTYSEDVIQIFSSNLGALLYSGSTNPSSPPSNLNLNAVCVLNDSVFYVSGITTSAYPAIVAANAPDPTFAGASEGLIMRETLTSTSTPSSAWGTYVGGNNSEGFAAISLTPDHTKLVFSVHTVVGTGYPAVVNAVKATPGGATELLVGVIPVSATPQTAFSVFSYLGGSGNEGIISDVPESDKTVVCADNNYFYVGGNTYSTDLAGAATGVQPALKGGIDQFISRIPLNGSVQIDSFRSTYNGGSGTDLIGGIAVDFRSNNVLLFGTTGSTTDFPVLQTTPSSPYYQSTFGGGSWDIAYGSFSNDLTKRTFGTYIGGSNNDYLGSTGVLRGCGHLFYNLTTGLINIGTTIHSDQTTIPVQWMTDIPGFDKIGGNADNDNHFVFEWDPNTYDYGDAPASYDGLSPARSALSENIRLGLLIDAETAPYSSYDALGDDTTNLADEDGVVKPLPTLTTGTTTYSLSVSVYNNTGLPITLAGWLDANSNHLFDNTEYTTMSIPTSTSQQHVTLTWTGLVPLVYGTGQTFVRLRLTDGPVTAFSDTGEIQAGEVEDYQICIKPNAGVDQTICIVGTATMAATGTGTWTALSGNPGTATITSTTSPTTTITGFSTIGTYNFLWTNSTGCSDTAAVIVTAQPGSVTISPSIANICGGESVTLSASASPTGGTYQWSPLTAMTPSNGIGASVTVAPAATQTYSVVYTLGGCTSGASRAVTVYSVSLGAHAGGNQTYCSSVSTTISLGGGPTATGGSGSYTYTWSPGTRLSSTTASNPTITSIVSSTTKYYVTVTDAVTGCTAVDSMVLTINPSVSVSIALSDTNLCLGQSTPLVATGTPSGGSYIWTPTISMSPAAGNTASVTVSPSANQTYTVVYSLTGCTGSAARTINVYPNVAASAGGNQTFCLPVSGTITLGGNPSTAIGGSGSFTYAWSPSTNLSSTSVANPTIISPVAGTTKYYVTVTDTKSGCTAVDSMVLTINAKATVTISSADTNLCTGLSTALIASGSPAGGTYQWNPTIAMTPIAGNTASVTVAPTSNQTYQVTYTASGCSGTATKTVNVVSTVLAHGGGNQTYCMPVSGTITLGAVPAATGGSGSYTYLWSPNTRISSTSVSNPTITSIIASTTTYKLLVTDNVSGCSAIDSVILTINPAVTANAGPDTSICAGFSVKIGGSPTGSGGTGALTYAWAPGTGLSAVNISNPTASPASLTSYVVTVTDSKGCSASSSTSVSVNPNPSADAGPSQNLTACSAATVTLGSNPTGNGGTGTLVYNWSPSAGLDSTTVPNPTVSQLGSTTTYRVTVTDSKGCTATSSTIVTVVSSTLQVDAGTGGSYCAGSGGSVPLSGSVTGGTAPYRYIWTPSTGLSDTNQATTSASPTAPGSYLYNLNVTDTNGCQASDTVRVTVYPYVFANAGSGDSVCAGYSIFVGGSPTGSGGTGTLTYQWASAPGLNPLNVANPAATPAASITYSVTVTDSKNCSASSSVFVKVNQNPVAHAGNSQSFCLPVTTTISLGASQAATGGSGIYTYKWSPTINLSDSTTPNPTVTVNGATNITYKLTVTDAVTGCTSVDSTKLTILAQPSVSISTADSNVCNGQSTVLTAVGSPAGGSYQWAPLVNIAPGNGASASVTVTPSNNQTYQVIYTQNTCTDTAYKTVVVYSTVVASAAPNQSFCLPVTATITIGGHPSASGGSGHYSYLWSPVTNLSSRIVANPTITTIVAGTTVYTLTVTDSLTGCSSVDSMVLTINPITTVSIVAPDTSICEGQSTTLTATGSPVGGTYQWSPTFNMNPGQGNTASVIVAPSGTQPYQVTYNASGCSGTATTTIYVYPKVVSEAGQDQSFCLPYSGTITIGGSPSASGGSGNYSYRWFPGINLVDSTIANPTVNKVNTNIEYYLEVTDNVTGCTSIDSMHLHIDTHATLSIAATDTNICFGQSAVLTAVDTPSGGTYQWSPIVYLNPGTGNTQSVTVRPTATQLYQLVYSRNGCNDTAYQDVNVYPDVTATTGGNQTYCLPITGMVTLGGNPTAKGGSGNYIYTWAPNINLSDSTVANPTLVSNVASTVKYYLTVTDAVTGCSATDSMVLTITQKPSVTIFSLSTSICAGSYATLTATGLPSGGNYQWEPIIAIIPGNGNAATVQVSPSSGFQTYFVYYSLLGCADTASVQINTYPQPVANAGPSQIYCLPVGSTVTLGGSPTATGGSGNFSYHWTPSANVSDSAVAHPTVDSLSTPGVTTYIVTVTDNVTGCTSVDSMQLVLLPKPIVTITSPDTNLCAGQNSILIATGNPTGGTYQWAPLGTISPFAGNTDTITVAPSIGQIHYQVIYNYNLTTSTGEDSDLTTNFIGCYDTAYQTVHVYPTVVANAGPDVSKCLPLSSPVTIGGSPSATGGSGNFSYQWFELAGGGAYILNNNTLANPTVVAISATGPATFILKVTDNLTGCSSTDTMVLSIFPQTTVSIVATDTNICVGGSVILSGISGTPTGGTYQWYPLNSIVPGNGLGQTVTVSPTSNPQTYYLIYTTNNICADTVAKTINVYPVVVAHGGGPRNFCSPINTVTLGGAPTATGGTGHYSYAWSPKATLNDSTLANPTATPLATTTYYLTVTDLITGCTSVDSVLVTQKPGPPAKTGPTTSICTGGSVVLSASGGISYVWSNGSTLSNDSSCCPIARPGATTIYTVTVTDINGCTASAVDTINVGSTLVFSVPTVAICQGDTGILTPSLLGLNYRYAWSPGTGLSCVSCATPQVFAGSSTIYSLTITDTINGCSGSDTGLVIVHPNPIADFFGSEVCQGQRAQFTDSSTSVDPIVRWFYNFGDSTLTGDTSDLQNPTYIYQTFNAHNAFEIVTTIYGCSNSTHRPVYSFPPVTAYAGHDTCVALGSSIVLGATGADHFSWTPTASLTNYNTANPVAHPDTTTEYTVVVTNDNGCFDTASVLVTVVPLPNANAGPDTFVCVGNSIKLLGSSTTSGVVTFHWSSIVSGYLNSTNISQPTVTPTAPGLYTFVLTTSLYDTACNIFVSSNDTMILTVDPVPQITANPDSLDVCGNPVNITFNSSLATTTYSWTGSNGTSGTGNISTFINNTSLHDSTVIYTVVGTAPGGCTDTIRVPVIAHPVPVLTATGFPAFICSGTYYTGTVGSNTPGTTITWGSTAGPNGSGGNINVLFNNPGTIPDTIIFSFNGSRNGCVANTLYDTVIVYPLPTASAGPNVTMVSCSSDSIQIGGNPTASGGTPGYTYMWAPNSGMTIGGDTLSNPYVKNLGANTGYSVTVTDSKGCSASSSMNVTVQPPTLAVSISPPGISTWCASSGNSVALTANVSGGNPLYSFVWSPSASLSDTFSQSVTASPQAADTVVYTVVVTDRNGCQASATKEIIVKPQPHPVITNLDSVYCANIVSVPLTASIPGGTWSGPGVFGSTFRPSLAGLGTYTIVYTLTSGGCTNDTFQTITVDSLPVVSITGANPTTYCSMDPSVTYTGSPAGGTWSGPGIDSTTGLFNPSLVSIPNNISRTITIRYHFSSAGGCGDSASTTVTVNKSPSISITMSADTICQHQSVILVPHFSALPPVATVQWFNINGSLIITTPDSITVNPTQENQGYYATITSTQGCQASDTVSIHVNQSPYAAADYDTICGITTDTINVLANDTDPENNAEVVQILIFPRHGKGVVSANEVIVSPSYGYYGYDTLTYSICNAQCLNDCDTANVYLSICPRNLPPTADTIRYTQLDSVPQDVNVILATSSPNGTPLTISLIGDSSHADSLTVIFTGNGSYTITGNDTGTFVIQYQVCDSSQYPVYVLCDSSVIIAHIVLPPDTITPQPPVANNDYATTTGTAPAVVNVRGNDYTNPTSHGLTTPTLIGNTTTADGTWSVNGGMVIFQPKSGLAQGIYRDTIHYQVCDLVNGLCATAFVVVTTDEIDTPANRPPVAVNDHETVGENTTSSFNVKANDSDPDGDSLSIPHIFVQPVTGMIVSVADNGTVVYKSNTNLYSTNGQPIDSFAYYICDTLAAHPVWPLCDTAEVYIYVTPRNLPPTADTIVYTQLVTVPQDVNVSLATSDPNGDPLTISLIGDSTDGHILTVIKDGNGAYTITGNTIGTYVITYQVCDTDQYPIHVLCDTSFIIAHIVPPFDTLSPRPPVANNDFATTTGTTPATVNVRGNDYTNPTSHGLTVPTLIGNDTTADGIWSVNGTGQVVFQPNAGLAPGIYYDTIQYQVCDLVDVPQLCATAYVVVTTNEIDTPVYNRPPVAVNDHETVPMNTTSSFNVKANDSDPDGNPLTIPTIVSGDSTHNGAIVSIGDNGTIVYAPHFGVHSINGQPVDSFKYYICDSLAAHPVSPLCDSAEVYIYVVPQNLPPTADTISYTQLDSIPQDVNVILSTSSPNGTPLTISLVGDSSHNDSLTVINTGNGSYTIIGNDTGTYVITYQVCDSSQYPIHVLCDTSVIIAHIIPPADTLTPQPPVANNDFATTSGTAPAIVNVLANDYSNPTSHGLTTPVLTSSTTTADGTWSVNGSGQVVFQPNAGLTPGIYYDTVHYQVCDLVDLPQLCATAYVVVTTDEIDTPIANRPPVAVNDHETVPMNTTSSFNVKANDSDPDGDSLSIPHIITGSGPHNGTIVSVADNGTIAYTPHSGLHSINGQPVDSFEYYICDTLAAHPVWPLCDTAEVYIYITPQNLPPTADTIMYTQLDSVPQDVNVISVTSSPNGTPLTISLVGDSSHNDSLTVINTGNGSYTITGNDTGTYVITYQVCDSSQYPIHVLCDTSVIIAHIIPPADTLTPEPPTANNDFATTSGTAPAIVNVRANDYSNPTSHGLTTPVLTSSTTTADGTWSVNGTGQVVFQPNAGLAPGIYYDTVHYQVCDLVDVPQLCATAYVVVTTNEIDNPANRPPVAVNDHETIPMNTTSSFNVKANDSDPDGDSLSIPHIVIQPVNGTIVSVADNGTVVYKPNTNVESINNQPVDSFEYYICDTLAAHPVWPLCDTAEVYIYVTPRNLPPTADTIIYTQLDSVPQDVNVISATSDPNGDPLTISLIGDSTDGHNLIVVKNGNGSYTITGNTIGTYVITYQVCDTDKYPIHVLCDTSVIIAHIVPPSDTLTPQPPVANNDFATTSGTTPATVNVLANDYSNPTSHGLTTPQLISTTTTADGIWTVNGSGQVIFQPNSGLAPGIYYDTVYYRVCDLVDIPQLCATAYVVVTTNEIDTPIANRPPVAVDDHETVPENVPTGFNVKINDSDPDGDSLTIPTIVVQPLHGTILSVGENGTVVYQSDTNIHSTNSHTPVDSFKYFICDTLAAYPVRPLCDSAEVYIYVPQSLFAINDTAATSCSTPIVICVKNNDYDTEHDSFYVKGIVTPPAHGTATLDSTQCVTYTPNGYAASFPGGIVDSFRYYDQDLLGATDSAWVYVKVICCTVTANNDTFTTHFGDTLYGNILRNDLFNDSLTHIASILPGSGPTNGTVTVFDSIIIYIPHSGFCGTDNFKYILTGSCGQDTASVHITVLCDSCQKPIAVNDSSFHGYSCKDTINVLANDTFGVGGAIVTVIKAPLYGTDTVINNNIVYTPDGTHPSTLDSLQYSLCNSCGQCDTATVWIQLLSYPCAIDHPIVNNVVDSICKNTNALINVLASDSDPANQTLYISLVTNPAHGSAFNQGDTLVLYHPDSSFVGVDTFAYQVCNTGAHLCNTAFVFVDVLPCLPPPIIVDSIIRDTTVVCTAKTFCIDSIYQGAGYTVRFYGFCDSASHGSVLLSTDTVKADSTGQLCFTYTPNCDTTGGAAPYTGNDTFCLVICDTGHDTVCTVTHVIMTILPIPSDDTLTAHPTVTYICNQPDTVHVLLNDGFPTPGNPTTGTAIYVLDAGTSAGKAPSHGTVSIGPGDSTVIYIPDSGYSGVDTFLYVITNNGLQQLFDTSIVYVYVCTPPHPIAVNDNPGCLDTTGYVDQIDTINIIGNDTLFPATDTAIIIIDSTMHGRLIINPNFTVTYVPDSGFRGSDNFSYQIAEFVGTVIGYSDTATVCIDVVDTVPVCFFPNGISPNGDGINDVFVFPCNDQYPNASLLIFNRWGDKIWEVDNGYKNDWGGTNLQGTPVPDGTYYFVYKYNDGSGRSTARFVVVYRGQKQ